MKLVQHPNVVRLYEVIDTQTKLYLILELGDGGDLYDYIMRHDSGLSEEVYRGRFNLFHVIILFSPRKTHMLKLLYHLSLIRQEQNLRKLSKILFQRKREEKRR